MRIKIALLIFILALLRPLLSEDREEIKKLYREIFSDKEISFVKIDYQDLKSFLTGDKKSLYELKNIEALIKQREYEIKSLKTSFVPLFNFSSGYNNLNFKERLVSVYSKIPVEWDNENLEKIDINLPNGGHGLLWLPKPIEYAWKYNDVHASREYESGNAFIGMGLNHTYQSGVKLNLMGLNLTRKFLPKSYGFSWSSTLSNSITVPLLELFDNQDSESEKEIKRLRAVIDSYQISLKNLKKNEVIALYSSFLALYLNWQEIKLNQRLEKLLELQIKALEFLFEKRKITIFEKKRIENEYQNILNRQRQLYYEVIKNSNELDFAEESYFLFMIDSFDINLATKTLEDKALLNASKIDLDKILAGSEEFNLALNNLENQKWQLNQAKRAIKPSLELSGGLDLYVSNDLGYETPVEALQYLISNPDGYNLQAQLDFAMPLSFASGRYNYQAVKARYNSEVENLRRIKNELKLKFNEFKIALLGRKTQISSLENSYFFQKEQYLKAKEFYRLKRITEYDYAAYKKELYLAEFNLEKSRADYLNLLLKYFFFCGNEIEGL